MSPSTSTCPSCGAKLAPGGRFCGQCGRTVGAEAPAKKTVLLGGAAESLRPSSPAQPAAPSPLARTTGPGDTTWTGPGADPRSVDEARGAVPGAGNKTMLGMPHDTLFVPRDPGPSSPDAGHPKTMLGVAIPGIAPIATGGGSLPLPSQRGTMLGVAIPGVAPQRPHEAERGRAFGPSGTVALAAAPPAPPIVPAPTPFVDEPLPVAPPATPKRGVPALLVVAIVFAVVLGAGVVAAVFTLRGGSLITAEPQLDENGRESLKLRCASCPEETKLTLGAASATVKANEATLALPAPLSIGDNKLVVHIQRPGSARDEAVTVFVPVAYRVRADPTTLSSRPPAIMIRVEATPGSTVVVDDHPVALDEGGRGAYALDLTTATSGPSHEAKAFERNVSFRITPRDGAEARGQLTVRTSIVPLHIEAPGLLLVTTRSAAAIVGQTRPSGTVTIDGQAVALDEQGRFAVRAELPASGDKELTIIAAAPPLAPRTVRATVRRTASLEAEAKLLDAEAPARFDVFAKDPASKIGTKAVVEGEVVEARPAQGTTVLLVAEQRTCPGAEPCLVRIVRGEDEVFARGEPVRAYGRIVGSVTAGGRVVPSLEAALILRVDPKRAATVR